MAQTAAKLVLEPIFEADLDPAAYGYRPMWSAADAIKEVHVLLCRPLPSQTRRVYWLYKENITSKRTRAR